MKCSFCGRELERGIQECPYCHCRIETEVQVLRPEERDTFEGVTIEEDGSTEGGTRVEDVRDERRAYEQTAGPKIRVHSFGCGSGILMTLLILGGILAIFLLFIAYIFDFCRYWRRRSIYYAFVYVNKRIYFSKNICAYVPLK